MKKIMHKGIVGVIEDEKIEGDYCGHLLINVCDYKDHCVSRQTKPIDITILNV